MLNYMQYTSFHPKKMKHSIPYAQRLSLHTFISTDEKFTEKVGKMGDFFEQGGYPVDFVEEAKDEVTKVRRNQLLQVQACTSI